MQIYKKIFTNIVIMFFSLEALAGNELDKTLSPNIRGIDSNISLDIDEPVVKKNIEFDPQIFSLSKKKESAFDSSSATYVLSSEDIRRSGATSIPEALRLVPGVQVSRINGHTYAITVRGFQRQFSNKLLVMVDGRTIYNTLFSGVFWDDQDYVLEDIDRIEVVRGPGGTIWGANAVNGVINIITKSASQTKGLYFSQISGNKDKSITELRYGGENKNKDSYRLYAKSSYRDGLDRYGSGLENKDANFHHRLGFRYDITSIKNNSLSIKGDVFRNLSKNYFTNLNNPQQNDKSSSGGNLLFGWDSKLSKKSKTTFNTYLDYKRYDIPVLMGAAKTLDFDFQHFYNYSLKQQLTWGVGYRQIQDYIKQYNTLAGVPPISYEPSWRNDQLYTAFFQDKISLNEITFLILGTKLEKNEFTGFEYQPSARLVYYPKRNQTLWGSVSRAVRTPTRGEDDIKIRQENSTLVLYTGSDKVKAENMIAYELGYRIKPTYKSLIDIAGFYNKYNKLRTWEGPATSSSIVDNNGKGYSYGLEVNGKWQATDKLLLEVSYDYLQLKTKVSNFSTDNSSIVSSVDSLKISEGQSPQNQFRFRSFYNLTSNIEFDNILYYVDPLPTGAGNRLNQKGLPSFVRFDTRIGYQPLKELELSFGIQNLFNKHHREFKPATYNRQTEMGRMIYGKVVWQY